MKKKGAAARGGEEKVEVVASLRYEAVTELAAHLTYSILAKLGRLEANGVAPGVIFASALKLARETNKKPPPVVKKPPSRPRLDEDVKQLVALSGPLSASLHSVVVVEGRCFGFGLTPCGINQNFGDSASKRPRAFKLEEDGDRVLTAAAGWAFTLAVRDDGALFSAGLDEHDEQLRTQQDAPRLFRLTGTLGAVRVVAVAAGAKHGLALDESGAVWGFGSNDAGQLGRPSGAAPAKMLSLPACRAVSAGASHSLLISRDGTGYGCGHNGSGRLGTGDEADHDRPVPIVISGNLLAVAAGKFHSLALVETAPRHTRVFAFGDNSYGQLGVGDEDDCLLPKALEFDDSRIRGFNACRVATGSAHSLVLFENGEVHGFGSNKYGQLGPDRPECRRDEEDTLRPPKPMRDNFMSGDLADEGQTDDDADERYELRSPVRVACLCSFGVTDIAAGDDVLEDYRGHSIAMTKNGVLAIGYDFHGQLGHSLINNIALTTDRTKTPKIDFDWKRG